MTTPRHLQWLAIEHCPRCVARARRLVTLDSTVLAAREGGGEASGEPRTAAEVAAPLVVAAARAVAQR